MKFITYSLFSISLLISQLAFSQTETKPTSSNQKPNILFILADDLGYGDTGCYGGSMIKTPNIDKLATEGIRFTQAYAGNTVCAPSRCALMTGIDMGHARIRGNDKGTLFKEDVTLAEVLKTVGYETAMIGKWGLGTEETPGSPQRQGWDYSFGYLDQEHAHDYWTTYLFRNGKRVEIPPKTYSHDLFTKEAIEFLQKKHENPFFLYLAYTIPHLNLDPPTDEPYSKEPWPKDDKNYAAMVTRMDTDIGKLIDLLKEQHLAENTIVVFTSDNGPEKTCASFLKGSGLLRGIKRDLYEGGIRIPFILRWPGKAAVGTTSDQVLTFWDMLPTFAEISGAKTPESIDGISMLPAWTGQSQKNHEFLYWEFHEKGFSQAVRMGDWKAIRLPESKTLELYNLKEDIGEKSNVASQHPDIIAKIEDFLKTYPTEYKISNPEGLKKKKAAKK
jgi:arylsulfatase A-like enzyme